LSVTRGWWLAWTSSEPRFSGVFELEIVERAPQNIKLLREHMHNLRKIGQLGNLNIHIPGTKHSSPKHVIAAPAVAENVEKVVEQDPSLRPGDMFRLKSVKFPGYELGITSVKLKDEYYYLGLRKVSMLGSYCMLLVTKHGWHHCVSICFLLPLITSKCLLFFIVCVFRNRSVRATRRTTPGACARSSPSRATRSAST
jgi:hypothetical protein